MTPAWFMEALELHRRIVAPIDYDPAWPVLDEAVAADPQEALRVAVAHLRSADVAERAVAADVLGCLGVRVPRHRRTCVRHLTAAAKGETDHDVEWSIVYALAHLADPASLPTVARLRRSEDADVRYQVAQALPRLAKGRQRDRAVRALLELAGDVDGFIREKAEEGIAEISAPE